MTLCKHRIDGCYYAVKQIPLSGTPAKRSATLWGSVRRMRGRRKAMREVQLASVLSRAGGDWGRRRGAAHGALLRLLA